MITPMMLPMVTLSVIPNVSTSIPISKTKGFFNPNVPPKFNHDRNLTDAVRELKKLPNTTPTINKITNTIAFFDFPLDFAIFISLSFFSDEPFLFKLFYDKNRP